MRFSTFAASIVMVAAISLAARRFQVKEEDEKNDEPGYLCAFRTRASFDRTPLKISYAAA
jgi:hypothetical protein